MQATTAQQQVYHVVHLSKNTCDKGKARRGIVTTQTAGVGRSVVVPPWVKKGDFISAIGPSEVVDGVWVVPTLEVIQNTLVQDCEVT
jgi:hypothetical protein